MTARERRHAERIQQNLAQQALVLQAMQELSPKLEFGEPSPDASVYEIERWDEYRDLQQTLFTLERGYDLAVRTFGRARFGGAP